MQMNWKYLAIGLGLVGCASPAMHSATGVQFKIQSPFCGPYAYPFRFSIDSAVVGNDTLRDKDSSPLFATTPGPHRLEARMTGQPFQNFSFDTTVTVVTDTVFVQIVDVYCS